MNWNKFPLNGIPSMCLFDCVRFSGGGAECERLCLFKVSFIQPKLNGELQIGLYRRRDYDVFGDFP